MLFHITLCNANALLSLYIRIARLTHLQSLSLEGGFGLDSFEQDIDSW